MVAKRTHVAPNNVAIYWVDMLRSFVRGLRDFPQTKLDGEINSPFLLNEHDDPRMLFQVFAKKSLIKNIFEEEKKFDSGTRFFFGK